jgi:outer membrane protein
MNMRYQIRIGLLLTFIAVAGNFVCAQAPFSAQMPAPPAHLTIDDARRIALQNHPQIRAAQSAAAAANEMTVEAKSAYYPNLYGSLTGVEADSGSRIAAGALSNSLIYNRLAAGVSVGQLVTDFGRTHNLVASSSLQAQAAQAEVNLSRADVLLAVDRAFYGALRAQAILRVAQQTVKQRETVSEQITTLAQNKLKSGLDVSFANVNLAEARLQLVQAQNDVRASVALLAQALGYSGPQQFDLAEPAESSPVLPALQDAMTEAERDRPELVSQKLQVESAQRFATAERDLVLPTISLMGAAGEVPFRQPEIPENYAAAGFNVNVPIFNGKLFSARHAEAEDRAREAAAVLNDEQTQVARDVQLAWLSASTASQNIPLTAQLFAEANKALDLAQARYDLGLGSIVELSQAQLNQAQAGIAQASAKYDYATRLSELAYQEGVVR